MTSQFNEPKNPDDRPNGQKPIKEDLANYFKNHARETISYILLLLGILLLFTEPVYGGLIVGIIAGVYFGEEFINYIKTWKTSIKSESQYAELARHLIFAGVTLAFFICAPAIFLGAAISIGIKQLFIGQDGMR